MEELVEIDMPFLDEHQLSQLIVQCAPRYQTSYTDELAKMTEIVDPQNTIKTSAMGEEWNDRFVDKWQL
jgi:hypothetical protein